ncbi:MAG: hypothetical protein DWQ05_15095 [Calditrichaeota bacterium]|nr:MAG: hypothetical protein DWQ05_15095 [Calditrichota bacterium]
MFRNVRLFFIMRIVVFLSIGIGCYIFFALQQFTPLADFPNLWEVIITTFGGACVALGSYYWSSYRMLHRIDDYLMGEVDRACNYLIDADDPKKLKPHGNIFIPKLLVEQVCHFGNKILKTFCQKQTFSNAKGGIFCVKDPILPPHPRSIYPEKLANKIESDLFKFIDLFLELYPNKIAIFRTDKQNRISRVIDFYGKNINLEFQALGDLLRQGIKLPYKNAIITPIFLKKSNIGYLMLFYKSQHFIAKILNPREMIDNFMLKKIEDWKLDDAIQSIIQKERLLLSFYLEKTIDDVTTPLIRTSYSGENKINFPEVCKDILEAICKILKMDKGGFLYHSANDELVCYTDSLNDEEIHRQIVPYTKSLLATNNKKVSNFKIRSMGTQLPDVDFENVFYVKIEYDSDELGLLGLFATREMEEFDRFVLDIIEDIKLDDLFLHYKNDAK